MHHAFSYWILLHYDEYEYSGHFFTIIQIYTEIIRRFEKRNISPMVFIIKNNQKMSTKRTVIV